MDFEAGTVLAFLRVGVCGICIFKSRDRKGWLFMSHARELFIFAVLILLSFLTGCNEWDVKDIHVRKTERLYVELAGETTKLSELEHEPTAKIKIYADPHYQRLIQTEEFLAGADLRKENKGKIQIFKHELSGDIRVGNSTGQYKVVCIEISIENSNLDGFERAGCAYTDGYKPEEFGD